MTASESTYSPTELLEHVKQETKRRFPQPVTVEGRVVEQRTNGKDYVTLTLSDPNETPDTPASARTRLEVSLSPSLASKTEPEAQKTGAVVHVTGKVDVWVQAARVNLYAHQVLRTGHRETPQSFRDAIAAIERGDYRSDRPPLSLLIGKVLLVAPRGTSLGDITEDLDVLVPKVIHATIPGDSPDLGEALRSAVSQHPDVDAVVLGRGGTIEDISGWDAATLLEAVRDIQQQTRLPVIVAVGHAEQQPLVYRVAGYTKRNLGEVGTALNKRNRHTAERIDGLADRARDQLTRRLDEDGHRLTAADRRTHEALLHRIHTRTEQLQALSPRLRDALSADLDRITHRLSSAAKSLDATTRRHLEQRALRLEAARNGASEALANRIDDRTQRLEITKATLTGFTSGLALISNEHGERTRLNIGENIRVDTADTTAYASVYEVIRHTDDT